MTVKYVTTTNFLIKFKPSPLFELRMPIVFTALTKNSTKQISGCWGEKVLFSYSYTNYIDAFKVHKKKTFFPLNNHHGDGSKQEETKIKRATKKMKKNCRFLGKFDSGIGTKFLSFFTDCECIEYAPFIMHSSIYIP